MLKPINLHYILNSWGRHLNVNKIVTSEQFKSDYWFILNGLYYNPKNEEKAIKKYGARLVEFYSSIFDNKDDKPSIKACVEQ